jgi:hypothetical protein
MLFTIEYTVYEEGNIFCPVETYTAEEVLGKAAVLLADLDYDGVTPTVKSVLIERAR